MTSPRREGGGFRPPLPAQRHAFLAGDLRDPLSLNPTARWPLPRRPSRRTGVGARSSFVTCWVVDFLSHSGESTLSLGVSMLDWLTG